MRGTASWHAIYVLLNDSEFFPASLRSVYPHVTGVTVVTAYDRDRWDQPVAPDSPIERILSRELDPERKVNVVVSTDVSEARLRNQAMAFANPPRPAREFVGTDRERSHVVKPDLFWIVDADEVYEDADVARLQAYVEAHPARSYLVHLNSYFKSWNFQVEEVGPAVTVLRAGEWFGDHRHRRATLWLRLWRRLSLQGLVPKELAFRMFGARIVPRSVAVFHHGSYVGDRKRIVEKLTSSGHRHPKFDRWIEEVWDRWTPAMTDFHPDVPEAFPSARHVATSALPAAIQEHEWPAGWIER